MSVPDRIEKALVTFELRASDAGTILVTTESNANADGWDHQTRLLAAYLDSRARP